MEVAELFDFLREVFASFYSKFILAVITLFIGIIIGRFVGKLLKRVLSEVELDNLIKKTTKIKFSLEDGISGFAAYFIYFITIIMALNQLGITTRLLEIISVAILIIIVLSVLLGIREFIPNVMSGIFIHQKRFIRVGDKVRIGEVEGKITKVSLTETWIRTKNGDLIYMPNSLLTKKEVVKLKQ